MSSEFGCFIQVSLTECRPSTATTIAEQGHLKTRCFKNCDGRLANVRFMIPDKCIVPQNNFPARRSACVSMLREPMVKPLFCVRRQRTLRGDAQHFLHQSTQPRPLQT